MENADRVGHLPATRHIELRSLTRVAFQSHPTSCHRCCRTQTHAVYHVAFIARRGPQDNAALSGRGGTSDLGQQTCIRVLAV